MNYVWTFLLALGITSLGFSTPGMLNLTVLRRSLKYTTEDALWFAVGIAMITLVQAFIAVTFIHFLAEKAAVFEYLSYAGIVIFLCLSGYFFYQARHPDKTAEEEKRASDRAPFWSGLGLAAMNMLSLPFFVGYGLLLQEWGWLRVATPHNYAFAVGAALGGFIFLALYARFADWIDAHIRFVARNINYILSLLFLVMTGVAAYRALGV